MRSKKSNPLSYNNETEPTAKDAKATLANRGLRNPHIVDVCYDLALRAAEQAGITPNSFYFQNGIVKTLASHKAKSPQLLDPVPDEGVTGELSNLAELKCIHDYSVAWRVDAVDFTEFLRLRRLCKTDAFELGTLLGKDFEDCCQGEWAKFLPQFNPDTLPANYTQKEMRAWLDSISPVKDYLLMASRNSMKSSFVLVWLLTLHLCCPDARALLASETRRLSAGFIRSYRSYWERKPNQETMLQRLFPEYCIKVGEGSTQSFESPMAHLDLIAPSAESTSYESATVGSRCDVLINDDVISNLTVGTDAQIQKSIDTYDLLQKLREVLGSFSISVGTPWAPNDLYATQLKRNEEDGSLAFRIDPIVELRPHACHKMTPALLSTLTEDDVVSYLLPVRMPWRFVKKEIAANPTFALSQNFCVFPTEADAELRCQFERDALLRRTHPASQYGQPFAPHYLSLDRAWSLSKAADLSALAVGRVQSVEGKSSLVVVDCIMDRYRESELVKAIVDLIQKHRVKVFVFERERGHSELDTAVRRECQRRGIPVPWMKDVPIDNSLHAKAKRAKQMEMPIHDGRLHFVSGPWIDPLFAQFESFDGITRSTSSRKDDGVDAVAILWSEFGPKYKDEIPKEDEEKRKRETEEEYDRARRLAYHERMHGTAYSTPRAEPTQPTQSQASTDARFAVLPFGLKGRPSNR